MYTEYMYKNSLCHYGVKGQKWGDRRYQNLDGTYTPLGERRRLETLARTGNTVTSSSSRTNREEMARTGNTVRVNSLQKSNSRPLVNPSTNVKANLSKTTVVKPTLNKTAKKSTISNSKSINKEETEEKKTSRTTSSDSVEENKTTKRRSSTKKKKKQVEQQNKVNEQKNQEENKEEQSSGPLTEEQIQDYARRVIRGEFGNGQERKDKLGENYAKIQALVNAILLKGRRK